LKKGEESAVLAAAERIKENLKGVRVHIDVDDQKTPGAKFYHWEMKGVPLRVEIGPRDVAQNQCIASDRVGSIVKKSISLDAVATQIPALLEEIQQQMFKRAQEKQISLWHKAAKLTEFGPILERDNGIYQTGWCGKRSCEDLLREYKATTRCILENQKHLKNVLIVTRQVMPMLLLPNHIKACQLNIFKVSKIFS